MRSCSADEVMGAEFVSFVEEALDGRVLDGAVHSLGLPVGPGMLGRAAYPMVNVRDTERGKVWTTRELFGRIRLWATVAAL